jgi:hypothetical protein
MAISPPPNVDVPIPNRNRGQNQANILDAILGLYHPTWWLFLAATVFTKVISSSFAIKASAIEATGSLLLCGTSMVFLFLESKKQGCTGLGWRFDLKDWMQLALTVHALYFGLIHDVVSK